MIKSITVTNEYNETITIEMRNPEKSGFFIQSIEGLGSVEATINLSEIAGFDGEIFKNSKARTRNILIRIGYVYLYDIDKSGNIVPGLSIEELRRLTYKYFPIKRKINLIIETEKQNFTVDGYVESNEQNLFSKDSSAIISIICPDSYFYDVSLGITEFSSLTPLFEFPFKNDSLISKRIKFGELVTQTEKNIYYEGEVSTGFLIHIHCIGTATTIEIINSTTLKKITINTTKLSSIVGSGIAEGDDIYISTKKADKYAILARGATIYNILNAVITNIEWFELNPGDNLFTYTAATGINNLQFSFIYDVLYQGI